MEKKLMPGSTRNAVAALRFLYDVTLQKDWLLEKIIPVPKHSGGKCPPPKTPEKRPCAPEDGIRKMASLTARNRLFHDIVPDFRDRPAMENRVRFSYAFALEMDAQDDRQNRPAIAAARYPSLRQYGEPVALRHGLLFARQSQDAGVGEQESSSAS